MKLILCALRDKKSGLHENPHFVRSEAEAIRSLGMAVNQNPGQNRLREFAQDFELMALASFNDETGDVLVEDPGNDPAWNFPKKLVDALQLVRDDEVSGTINMDALKKRHKL